MTRISAFRYASLILGVMSAIDARESIAQDLHCGSCSIRVWQVGTLRGGDEGLSGDPMTIVMMPDRRLAFSMTRPQRPLYVASTASDEVSTLAGVGAGPGEVRFIYRMHRSWTDSLFVYDIMLRRMNVFSPSARHVRSFPFPMQVEEFVQLHDGRFMVHAEVASREGSGYPLHLVSSSGELLKSFGANDRNIELTSARDRYRMQRKLALSPDGSVLSVTVGSYVIERWSPDGTRLDSADVAPDWFEPKGEPPSSSPDVPKPPMVRAIQVDSLGRVWVLVVRTDPEWRESIRPPVRPPATYSITSTDEYHDSQIELLSKSFERIATTRVDVPLEWFVSPGVASSYGLRENDEPVIKLFRAHLVAP